MADTEISTIIRLVGQTPGFAVFKEGTRFQLVRLADEEAGITKRSIKVSTNSGPRQAQNNIARLRHMGWTRALHDRCAQISKEHQGDEEAAAPEYRKLLLEAVQHGEREENKGKQPAEPAAPAPAHRPVKKGTPGGSARLRAGKAQTGKPAFDPTAPAPVVPLPGAGRIQAEMITPERALELLANKAAYQRPLRKAKIEVWAAAMSRGEWELNASSPICLDPNGQLLNGQHRLEALLLCELAQPFYVAYDVDPETYKVMDRGTKRTTADMLHGAGEVNTRTLAAAARMVFLWDNVTDQGLWANHPEVTDTQIFEVIEKHPGLRASAAQGNIHGSVHCSPTGSVFAHYLISHAMGGDTTLATAWMRAMAAMRLPHGHPGHALGLFFLKQNPSARRRTALAKRSQRELDTYLIVKAWNATARGEERRGSVSWKQEFVIPHPIPPVQGKHSFPDELFD